jgi:hypothetical protein
MNYSVINLTQVADCNVLLTWAAKEKADLEFKKLSDQRLTTRYAETSLELDAILQGVLAEIAATDTIIAVLPDGLLRTMPSTRKQGSSTRNSCSRPERKATGRWRCSRRKCTSGASTRKLPKWTLL